MKRRRSSHELKQAIEVVRAQRLLLQKELNREYEVLMKRKYGSYIKLIIDNALKVAQSSSSAMTTSSMASPSKS